MGIQVNLEAALNVLTVEAGGRSPCSRLLGQPVGRYRGKD